MLRIGDKVKVSVPDDKTAETVRKFNGEVSVIRKASGWKNGQIYYELYGMESEQGIPYSFLGTWLQTTD